MLTMKWALSEKKHWDWEHGISGGYAKWKYEEFHILFPSWETTSGPIEIRSKQLIIRPLNHNYHAKQNVNRTTISPTKRGHRTQGLIRLLDRQGKHMWLIVMQLPMKTGWWDAPLALWDLAERIYNILQNFFFLLPRYFSSLRSLKSPSKGKKDFK